MTDTIKKLIERKIFKEGTLVDAPITKYHMGTPITVNKTLRIKQVAEDHCIADEEYEIEAEVPFRKIYFRDITLIDGMEPQELAAVYGLAPRTERFKRKDLDK
jgi:hypothetical protein